MSFYWGDEDVNKIKEFYYCASATTSGTTRTMIYTALLPKLNYLINNAINSTISSFSHQDKKELQQELLTHIWEILSNRLNPDKIIGVQNFLWLACRNYLHEIFRQRTKKKEIKITYTDDESLIEHFGDNDNEITPITETEIQNKILLGLDLITPKRNKSKINCLTLKFVKCLKQYLVENQFTQIEHFKAYALKELGITDREFILTTNKLHLSALIFKPTNIKKIIKREYNPEIEKINRQKYKKKSKKVIDEFY